MSRLFDENLSRNVARRLRDEFPGALHVADLTMLSASDAALWNEAKNRGLAIVSKDSHFQGMSFVHGHPPKSRRHMDQLAHRAADPREHARHP